MTYEDMAGAGRLAGVSFTAPARCPARPATSSLGQERHGGGRRR